MRKLLVAMVCMGQLFTAAAQQYDFSLIPYRMGNKWGYCDAAKRIVVKPQFDEAQPFEGPLAMAKLDSYYCVVNRRGDVVYKSTHFTSIMNGGSHIKGTENSYTERLYDENGKPLTPVYNAIRSFNKYGYAVFTMGHVRHGLLDKSFNKAMKPAFHNIEFLNDEVLRVYRRDTGFALVRVRTGKEISKYYDQVYDLADELLMVVKKNKCGFIDMRGREVIAPKYSKVTPDGVEAGERYNESTYAYFNIDGFYNGLAAVADEQGKVGFINKLGAVAIPFRYDKAYGFTNGRAWVKVGQKWGMIDTRGKYVLQPEYKSPAFLSAKELLALDGFHEGLIAVAKDSLYGYADTTGRIVIPYKYRIAEPFYEGLAAAYSGEQMGFIDRGGSWVIPPMYQWAEGAGQVDTHPFINGIAVALVKDSGWVLINKRGERILPHVFNLSENIWFDENGLANAAAGGKRYIFTTKGEVLYTFPDERMTTIYTRNFAYSYQDKCFIDISNGTKYCD